MKHKELLEMAAKAVGYKVRVYAGMVVEPGTDCVCVFSNNGFKWNPLTGDGDALRLAADLRLMVKPGKHKGDGCTVESQRQGIAGCTAFRDDPAEQMRVAIVTVAAEIGKAMP